MGFFDSNAILPLEYDNSLSYMEQLCKINKTVSELMTFFNGQIDTVIEKYILEHFNDLIITATYDEKTETITLGVGVKREG